MDINVIITSKITTVGASYGIVIPKNILEKFNINPGDLIEVEIKRKI